MTQPSGLLSGRRGLVVGVANERSIAFGIARAARQQGASIALSYQDERLLKRVGPIAEGLDAEIVEQCDLTAPEDLARLASVIESKWGRLDFIVHAVAHAKREELEGRFLDTSRDGFAMAMDVSVYTLVALTRALEPLLEKSEHHPAILTLTYYGSEKAMPNYNVMGVAKAALEASVRYLASELGPKGIRVNALSAGPIKTLSAAGVKGLRNMLSLMEETAPLRRNVTIDDVGQAALMGLADLGRGMTGEVYHVDAGYHIVGAPAAAQS